jgi:hypothetical protein
VLLGEVSAAMKDCMFSMFIEKVKGPEREQENGDTMWWLKFSRRKHFWKRFWRVGYVRVTKLVVKLQASASLFPKLVLSTVRF